MRTRSESEGFIQLLLPYEAQQQAVQFLERWPSASALTVIGGMSVYTEFACFGVLEFVYPKSSFTPLIAALIVCSLAGIARGADCHLVHVPGRPRDALLYSLQGSQVSLMYRNHLFTNAGRLSWIATVCLGSQQF